MILMTVHEFMKFYFDLTAKSDGGQDVTTYAVTFIEMPNDYKAIAEVWNTDPHSKAILDIYERIEIHW